MLYEFKCESCGCMEDFARKVKDRDAVAICSECGAEMRRIPSFIGALQTDHPVWLDKHCLGSLQPPDARPIETRGEHDRYCTEKGIIRK